MNQYLTAYISTKISVMISSLLVLTLLITMPMLASAHALKETNARITLRDGQIEVNISADLNLWQTRLQDNQAWLMGDIDQVMPKNLNPEQQSTLLKKILTHKTMLLLNNKSIEFDTVSITKPAESSLGHYAEIVLITQHKHSDIKQLSIQFPKSLGAVHASFVRPQYKMIKAGGSTRVYFSQTNQEHHSHH